MAFFLQHCRDINTDVKKGVSVWKYKNVPLQLKLGYAKKSIVIFVNIII